MTRMFRILITDASSKHSLPLQRHCQLPDIELIGHDCHFYPLCKHYGYSDGLIRRVPLEEVVRRNDFDMIIPYAGGGHGGGASARAGRTALGGEPGMLLRQVGDLGAGRAARRAVRKTAVIRGGRAGRLHDRLSCVVKPVCEVEMKGVFYVRDDAQRRRRVGQLLALAGGHGVLVQDASPAAERPPPSTTASPSAFSCTGRLRELPIAGAASTAVC